MEIIHFQLLLEVLNIIITIIVPIYEYKLTYGFVMLVTSHIPDVKFLLGQKFLKQPLPLHKSGLHLTAVGMKKKEPVPSLLATATTSPSPTI